MKKNFTLFAVLALALAGCAKEASVQDTFTPAETVAAGKVVYTLTANLPETKVTADRYGVFAWEGNETIAVWDEVSRKFIEFKNSTAETSTFTATLDERTSYNFSIAYYPATIVGTAKDQIEYPASYNSIDDIKPIMAAKVNSNSLTFTQLGALMHITINDVPSIADEILIEPNKEGAYFKGTYAVNTDDLTISSISGNHDAVTINGISGGKNEFYLPVPPGTYETSVRVHNSTNNVWLFDSGIGTERTLAQNDLINMKPININPTVYLIADFTDWNDLSKAAVMVGSGASRSITLLAYADTYYRYVVDYGNDIRFNMGPATNGSSETSEVFTITNSNSSKISSYGEYAFSFDYTTSTNTVAANAEVNPAIYLTGSFQNPEWNFKNDTPFTKTNKKEGYLAMNVSAGTRVKAYTNPYWGSSFPSADIVLAEANYYLFVANAETKICHAVYANATLSSASSMTLKGSFDSWKEGLPMMQLDSSPFWYVDVEWATETEFKFVNGETWMAYGDGSYSTSHASQSWGSDGNVKVAAGKYRIFASEIDGRFAILEID